MTFILSYLTIVVALGSILLITAVYQSSENGFTTASLLKGQPGALL